VINPFSRLAVVAALVVGICEMNHRDQCPLIFLTDGRAKQIEGLAQ
jgi:hypothetical protein